MAQYDSMADMVKVTFTLDDQTIERLRRTAARLGKPQSHVVREAIREYEARSAKLSDEERTRMLAIVDRMIQEPPTRTAAEVDAELGEIRASRRRWGRPRASTRRR
jgi:predicted transcriptional regulator